MSGYVEVFQGVMPFLLVGFIETLKLAVVSIVLGSVLGTARAPFVASRSGSSRR